MPWINAGLTSSFNLKNLNLFPNGDSSTRTVAPDAELLTHNAMKMKVQTMLDAPEEHKGGKVFKELLLFSEMHLTLKMS